MCECLEYDDGSMHLCECCAGMWREWEQAHFAKPPNWIYCSDRLPENDSEVIVSYFVDDVPGVSIAWYYNSKWSGPNNIPLEIIPIYAWQPYPEPAPYKGEEK